MRYLWLPLWLPVFLWLGGCSSGPNPEPAKTAEKPAAPVTGRQAFQSMYPSARAWAADAQPLELRSIRLQDVKAENGKAGAWQAVFVSPQSSKSRSYSYSAVEAPGNLHQGVFAGPVDAWPGPSGQAQPFLFAAIKVDSDEAYAAAAKHSAEYISKHPDQPVSFLLERTNRFPDPAWRVIWGETVGTSGYSVFVDASTGKYLETLH